MRGGMTKMWMKSLHWLLYSCIPVSRKRHVLPRKFALLLISIDVSFKSYNHFLYKHKL